MNDRNDRAKKKLKMRMKKKSMAMIGCIIIICVLIQSCSQPTKREKVGEDSVLVSKQEDSVNLQDDLDIDSIYAEQKRDSLQDARLGLSKFCKYQTFDEYKMQPIGKVKKSPYVFVRKEKDTIWVAVSSEKNRKVRYVRCGTYWYSQEHFNLENRYNAICKCRDEKYAYSYYRICGNNSIIEYCCLYSEGVVTFKQLFIKTYHSCISLILDVQKGLIDGKNIFMDMKLYVARFNREASKKSYKYKDYDCRAYKITERSKDFVFVRIDHSDSLIVKKNVLGYWNLRLGLDYLDRNR